MRHFFSVWVLFVCTNCVVAHRAAAAAVQGRVVDSSGRPVAGAEIRLWRKTRPGKVPIGQNEPVKFPQQLLTDAEGRYTTPDIGDAGQAVRVIALPKEMLAGRSAWVDGESMVKMPDIVPRRLRTVAGRVADRDGRGVSAAAIFHRGDAHGRIETATEADGRFLLNGVPEGLAPLFVEKAGFRFTGMLLDDGNAEIVVAREDEAPTPLGGGVERMPEAERRALGRRLLDQDFRAVVERGGDREKHGAIVALGHLDPIEALDRFSRCSFADKTWREAARGGVLHHWLDHAPADDLEEIRGMVEASDDEMWVATCYLGAADKMPADARQAKLEWINQGVLHARQCESPSVRTIALARAAAQLETLGEAERAAKLRAEARKIAPASVQDAYSAYALSDLAVAFSLTDLPAAMECLDKCGSGPPLASASSQVAIHLAAEKPGEAEKIWRRADGSDAPQFCFRLAAADLPRAERLAADLNDAQGRVRARAAIALALTKTNLPAARRVFRQVMRDATLAIGNAKESPTGRDTGATAMAWLLPVAEQVDPAAMSEVFWRAVALRSPAPIADHLEDEVEIGHASLAQMLARYDVQVARRLLAPIAARVNGWTGAAENYRQKAMHVLGAAAAINSQWAADLFNAMPEPPNVLFQHPKNECRRQIVRVLGMGDAELWEFAGYRLPK